MLKINRSLAQIHASCTGALTRLGVEPSYTEAVKWFRKAADQELVQAQVNLALCYRDGQGVEQSYTEAAKWYRKAAEQGDADAQYRLGLCYVLGKGVEQSDAMARFWLRQAAKKGYVKAAELLESLE